MAVLGTSLGLAAGNRESQAVSYQDLAYRYFYDRCLEFAGDLCVREEFLKIIYNNLVEELKARRDEGFDSAVLYIPFWKLEPAHLDRNDPALASSTIAERYRLWVDYEEREYQRRFQLIMALRDRLLNDCAASQKQRMFRKDFQQALLYYGQENYEMARMLFDRLLQDYDYQDVDDIFYYQGESCLQLQHLTEALSYYMRLIDDYPSSALRIESYERATSLLQTVGNVEALINLYDAYVSEGMPGDPEKVGGIHLRAAKAHVSLEQYPAAVGILERVSVRSPHYLASRYLLADCLTALEDWPRAVEVLTEVAGMKQKKMPYELWRLLTDEARIKLAFIYYQWEDYDKASDLFNRVRLNSPLYDRVLMGKAWIAYQLDQYEKAAFLSDNLLQSYPLSTEIYEAGSLLGYCSEKLGDKETATAHFLEVLEAGVGRNNLESFLEERRHISDALAELRVMEETVFASGDERLFQDYKRTRNTLEIGLKRIELAQLMEANQRMRELVQERVLLDSLIREKTRMETDVVESNQVGLIADFMGLDDRIYDLMERLNKVGVSQLKNTPLYYQEARIGYINSVADTLALHLDREIDQLAAVISKTDSLRRQAVENRQADECIKLGLRLSDLAEALDQGYLNQGRAEKSHRPVLMTRVDRWSDYSFNRYAMGGMEFEELDQSRTRLKQVEEYVAALDDLLDVVEEKPAVPEIPPAENDSTDQPPDENQSE